MKYQLAYDAMHHRHVVYVFTPVGEEMLGIYTGGEWATSLLFIPNEHLKTPEVVRHIDDLEALGTGDGRGNVICDREECEAPIAALLAYEGGVLRARMIQLKWSDETVWKDHSPLDPERDVQEQLDEKAAEFEAEKAQYRLGYTMALRVTP